MSLTTSARTLLLAALAVALLACGARSPVGAGPSATASAPASAVPSATAAGTRTPADQGTLKARAAEVVAALRDKDFAKLSMLAHPDQGIRFSPYAFVDVQKHVRLDRATIARGFTNPQRYLWGHTDGRGAPMDWTFEEFYTRQLWDRDYSKATMIAIDTRQQSGNSLDNSARAYPKAHVVEYHLPSTDPNTTLDWGSLRIVLEDKGGTWYVVGLIHDEWTI